MDYHGELKRLLRALSDYDKTGALPPDTSKIDAVCERVLAVDPSEKVARRWKSVANSDRTDPSKDEPWRQ